MRKSIPVMPFRGKGRQMENTDSTDTAKDWRQAWRAFADKVSGRFWDSHNGATPTSRPRLQEIPEGPFQGFDSPPGKF
jgi:hypothetical protein